MDLFWDYFRPLLIPTSITISIIQILKSVDGVPGIQTLDRRIVGADETKELWRPKPSLGNIFVVNN